MTGSTRPLILLVEDDPDVLEAIRDVLVEARYAVMEATSGSEAMAVLQNGYVPAAMVVDFMMAGMNGAEFLDWCSGNSTLARIPAVVISAARPADLAAEGISSYLPKPFQAEELLDAVERVLAGRHRAMLG
jgi:two-component system chemotaxis response regulator CheY